jgi:hypothetical protein
MLSIAFLIVLMSVIMLSINVLSVIMLSVIILSVTAPNAGQHDKTYHSTLHSKGRLQPYLQILDLDRSDQCLIRREINYDRKKLYRAGPGFGER